MRLPEKYSDFANVFDKNKADRLPKHSQYNLAIKIKEEKQPSFRSVYDKSLTELRVLRDYINVMLAKKFIWPSKSPSEALAFFVPKKNRGLCLYVDFWGLNTVIIMILICSM